MVARSRLVGALGCALGLCHCNQIAGLDALGFAPAAQGGSGADGGGVGGNAGSGGSTQGGGGDGGDGGGVGGNGPDAYAAAVLADAPIAYWRLDDAGPAMATDLSGNGYHGVYQGGVLQQEPGIIPGNGAARLADNNDAIHAMGPFDFGNNAACSIEAWFYAESSADEGIVVSQMDYVANEYTGWFVALSQAGNARFDRAVSNGGYVGSAALTLPAWTHVVATYNGVDTATLYINGVMVNDRLQPNDLVVAGTSLIIGDGANWANLRGVVDEVAIYDKALVASRILTHYEIAMSLRQ